MKILHLSTRDTDGGAAKGAYWLHQGLIKHGHDSKMIVARKFSDNPTVTGTYFGDHSNSFTPINWLAKNYCRSQVFLDKLALKSYKINPEHYFSPAWGSLQVNNLINDLNPDIINLHWINAGFLKPESLLNFSQPIVWTLRDTWAFTGGCHYFGDCSKYQANCGNCYQLNSDLEQDLSRKLWQRKHQVNQQVNITVVAISHWLADCARKSSIFRDNRIVVIPNALDETKFKPIPQQEARKTLGLPLDQKIITFGAINATKSKRKGFAYLISALKQLANMGWDKQTQLLVFGADEPRNPPEIGIPIKYLGFLNDQNTLNCAYGAADVSVIPSLEEAFGKTAIESMACGTPVVCFNSTGLTDIVEHKKNGYCAQHLDATDLATGIDWVLQQAQKDNKLSLQARNSVLEKFTLGKQSQLYVELYAEVLENYKLGN